MFISCISRVIGCMAFIVVLFPVFVTLLLYAVGVIVFVPVCVIGILMVAWFPVVAGSFVPLIVAVMLSVCNDE